MTIIIRGVAITQFNKELQKKMRRIFSLLLALVLLSGVVVKFNVKVNAADEGSIAVLLPDSASSARWEADDRKFLEAAFKEAGVKYTIVNANGDAAKQITQAEQ